jgi:hypothetical protein
VTIVLLIAVAVVAALIAARRWHTRPTAVRRDQVAAFTRARAVTSTWSEHPETTPAPLQEYLASLGREHQPDS